MRLRSVSSIQREIGEPMAAVSKGNMLPLPIGCIFSIVLRAQIVRMLVYRGTEPNTSTLAVEL